MLFDTIIWIDLLLYVTCSRDVAIGMCAGVAPPPIFSNLQESW